MPLPVKLLTKVNFMTIFTKTAGAPVTYALVKVRLFKTRPNLCLNVTYIMTCLFSNRANVCATRLVNDPGRLTCSHEGKGALTR